MFLVSCADKAGVVANAFSQPVNAPNWFVFAGDPQYGLANVNALVANVATPGQVEKNAD